MASADTVVDNLATTTQGSFSVGVVTDPDSGSSSTHWTGQGFTTAATGDFVMSDITMTMGYNSFQSTTSQFTISLYSNGGGAPGSLLSTIATADDSLAPDQGFGQLVFTPATQITLAPATTYWIVASSSDTAAIAWGFTQNTSFTGTGAPAGSVLSTDGGVTWQDSSNNGPFQLSVQTVPEPSTWALSGLGLLAVVTLRRRLSQPVS